MNNPFDVIASLSSDQNVRNLQNSQRHTKNLLTMAKEYYKQQKALNQLKKSDLQLSRMQTEIQDKRDKTLRNTSIPASARNRNLQEYNRQLQRIAYARSQASSLSSSIGGQSIQSQMRAVLGNSKSSFARAIAPYVIATQSALFNARSASRRIGSGISGALSQVGGAIGSGVSSAASGFSNMMSGSYSMTRRAWRNYRAWSIRNSRRNNANISGASGSTQPNPNTSQSSSGSTARKRLSNIAAMIMGKRAVPGANKASEVFDMLGNFMGGKLYYFAKGIAQASKNLGAWGVALYTSLSVIKLFASAVVKATRWLRSMAEYGDSINIASRKTRISSGSFGNAELDMSQLRAERAKGTLLISDEDYIQSKNSLYQLGLDYKDNIKLMQDLAYYTGQSTAEATAQVYDAVQFGGHELYRSLGMNEREVQRFTANYVEGTSMMRDLVLQIVRDQEGLQGAFERTPKTVSEMFMRIQSVYQQFMTTVLGSARDPGSLYQLITTSLGRLSDWFVKNTNKIAAVAQVVQRFFKGAIKGVVESSRGIAKVFQGLLDSAALTEERLPDTLRRVEVYTFLMALKIRNAFSDIYDFVRGFISGVTYFMEPIHKAISTLGELLHKFFGSSGDGKSAAWYSGMVVGFGIVSIQLLRMIVSIGLLAKNVKKLAVSAAAMAGVGSVGGVAGGRGGGRGGRGRLAIPIALGAMLGLSSFTDGEGGGVWSDIGKLVMEIGFWVYAFGDTLKSLFLGSLKILKSFVPRVIKFASQIVPWLGKNFMSIFKGANIASLLLNPLSAGSKEELAWEKSNIMKYENFGKANMARETSRANSSSLQPGANLSITIDQSGSTFEDPEKYKQAVRDSINDVTRSIFKNTTDSTNFRGGLKSGLIKQN